MLRGGGRLGLERPPLPLPPEGCGALQPRAPTCPIRLGTPEGSSADGGTRHLHGLYGGWGWQSSAGGPTGAQRLEGVRLSLPKLPAAHARSPHAAPPSPLGCSYLDTIEQAVSEGQTLLIEDVGETVEPVLDHLLGRNTIKKGRSAHPVL